MLVPILGDMHIGARGASLIVANFQLKFFEEQFFPYLKKHKIKKIIQTGDLFDSRKFSNHIIINEWKLRFFDHLKKEKIEFHTLLGNHDLATKNSTNINTPSLLLSEYDNIKIYNQPTEVKFGTLNILMVPWICLENFIECETMLEESNSLWSIGHFEIDGFEMHKGQIHSGGLFVSKFKRFEQVISGHFHTRSENKNIKYVGTPYEMTWIDFGDTKGFHILNTLDRELEFIPNEFTLFKKIYYDDKNESSEYFKSINIDNVKDSYIKLIVTSKTDPYQFDRFLDKLYQSNPADLKIIEDISDIDSNSVDDDDIEMEDTVSLIESYIDSIDTNLDNEKLKKIMITTYTEALEVIE